MYTEDLQSHYKAVRQRIINAAPQHPKMLPVVTQRPAPGRDLPVLITPRHAMIEALKGIPAQPPNAAQTIDTRPTPRSRLRQTLFPL